MTPDTNSLRVALLTELGWKRIKQKRSFPDLWTTPTGHKSLVDHPPKLDLNLVSAARKNLIVTDDLEISYCLALAHLTGAWMYSLIDATPDQHAAAILSALGKLPKDWRESTESKPLIIP